MILAFALDKPAGISSNYALTQIKKKFKLKKLGHTGTLDPFATGVLPVFIDEATKLIPYLDDSKKTYRAVLSLGKSTDTLDSTGLILQEKKIPVISKEQILDTLRWFVGYRKQIPPQYSAIKINGKPLYRYAREGQEVKLEPRDVHIYSLQLLSFENDQISFEAEVSRGTYIRVLGEEIAHALNTIGHLSELRRLQSGVFELKSSIPLNSLLEMESLKVLEDAFEAYKLMPEMNVIKLEKSSDLETLLKGQCLSFDQKLMNFNLKSKVLVYWDNHLRCVAETTLDSSQAMSLKPLRILHI